MNVLIFTGQFGMGHTAAAKALQEQILTQDPTAAVAIIDVVEECFPQFQGMVYGCFDFTVNYCAGIYNLLNRLAGRIRCTPMKAAMVQSLDQLLRRNRADLLISTLPLSSQYLSAYKQATGSTIPLYTYITDIYAHREWIAPATDCYFVGDESTRLQLLRYGVSGQQIHVSGVPVRQAFQFRPKGFSFPRELLVMGGGLGLIPKADELLSLLAETDGLHVTVIAGKNESLHKKLTEAYPAFSVVGFTHQVEDYMAQADLLLTKAGGITTFEAIHTGTPLCLLKPFLMQEEANAAYVESHGFGTVLRQKGREAEDLLSLLWDQVQLADMSQRMAVALRSFDSVTPLDQYTAGMDRAC